MLGLTTSIDHPAVTGTTAQAGSAAVSMSNGSPVRRLVTVVHHAVTML